MSSPNSAALALAQQRSELAELVSDSTDKNRQFFVLYLGLWVYVLLTVFGTTDQMLLVPTVGLRLPLVDVTIPLLGFYWVAPLFLLAIHFNLLQNLESHHYKLMRWKEAWNDKVPRQEIQAFLFDFEWLERDSKMEWYVIHGSRILFLHSGPLALGILFWRFTDYQNIGMTIWHMAVFTVDSYLVWLTQAALRRNEELDLARTDQPALTGRFVRLRTAAVSLLRFFQHLSIFLLHLLKTGWRRVFGILVLLQFGLAGWFYYSSDSFLGGWQSIINIPLVLVPIISIDPNETAWLPDTKEIETRSMLAGEENTGKWWKEQGYGLDLRDRHLRGFSAFGVYLPKLQLNEASDLQGADLSSAQLQGAHLKGAQLQGIYLGGAQLQGADLSEAKLQGATLSEVTRPNSFVGGLQMAKLKIARLIDSNLKTGSIQLQGANLIGAELQGANLQGAELQGVNLRFSELQGANLSDARLQGTDLSRAQLQGADLNDVELGAAIVGSTALAGSKLPVSDLVSYSSTTPFSHLKDTDWTSIATMSLDIPMGSARDQYEQRIRSARTQKQLNEIDIEKVLPNHVDVAWLKVIPEWDRAFNPIAFERFLAAARGLKSNYALFAEEEKIKLDNDSYHPEYIMHINQAFCASKHFKSLCETDAK